MNINKALKSFFTKPSGKHKVCYVLMAFPRPSETFISEEALSLIQYGVEPHILSLLDGNSSTTHPSAQELLDTGNVTYLKDTSKRAFMKSLAMLFLNQPFCTIQGVIKAFSNRKLRWLYFQMAPYAHSLLKNKINIIHAHFADRNLLHAKILADWTGIPFGVTTHGYDLRDTIIDPKAISGLADSANHIITISQYNKELMVRKYNLPKKSIQVVHCGIRLDVFSPSNQPNVNRALRLLSVGRLVPEKGHRILITALEKLKAVGITCNLHIIGEGPLREQLKQLAAELNVIESIKFLGTRDQASIINELNNADIYVMPSLAEGIPVACMEAMAMKLPVIATRITGLSELIKENVSGILVPSDNPEALAIAIENLSKDIDKQHLIGEQARKKIEEEFERSHNTKQLLQVFGLLSK